jgi:hypothetical protein
MRCVISFFTEGQIAPLKERPNSSGPGLAFVSVSHKRAFEISSIKRRSWSFFEAHSLIHSSLTDRRAFSMWLMRGAALIKGIYEDPKIV